ncbi:hypothetical protein [Moritella viscosa]|uniref:Uncharacterized protein n=1 Tax=Moritella viscosa TaxID=80854 RepID=A0ABY1HJ92_9GAMM|nr:hypothetical protein [Moritella viscosa]SGZ00505.1 unnamed protein product [Moritella viscosa]SGZ10329.1 unnamed protein product [Moritella viscosa]SHO14586.1 unnamed protein product [Moritella viscosa]SHO15434.1 unnamed protein product [Moritella viscosa]SHO18931.1 unnamed protein product [Moritella viscosa]
MKKKTVNLDLLDSIGDSAAHKKNNDAVDKFKVKTKNITYPQFWEVELFNEKIKNKSFSGTWQSFIREAIREKMTSLNIDIEQL